jgi:tetratricopeptide (TPR) repeat protein
MLHQAVALLVLATPPAVTPPAVTPASAPATQQQSPAASAEATAPKPFQVDLIELGFDAASQIPVNPHERDRARVQEVVATTALSVGMKTRSMAFANQIANWRKGVVYGDLAIDAAKGGRTEAVATFSRLSRTAIANAQQWQSDRVLSKLAQAQVWLGQETEAIELEKKFGEAEKGKVAAVMAARPGVDFDAALLEADRAVATGNFELTANALAICAQLAGRKDTDEARWSRIMELNARAKGKVAREIHIRSYLGLADARIARGESAAALTLVDAAKALRDEVRWAPEAELPITADIARRIAGAGDRAAGLAELEKGLASFVANQDGVADIFRAGAMCPAAEAFASLGEPARALEVYRLAVEAGALNPNARPRAEDLAQTTASLARSAIEPDAAMWKRLREIRAGLVEPW